MSSSQPSCLRRRIETTCKELLGVTVAIASDGGKEERVVDKKHPSQVVVLVQRLLSVLAEDLDCSELRGEVEFILIPFFHLLPSSSVNESNSIYHVLKDIELEHVLLFLKCLISKCSASFVQSRNDIFFSILYRLICVLTDEKRGLTEESKHLVVSCMEVLLEATPQVSPVKDCCPYHTEKRGDREAINQMRLDGNRTLIGRMISLLLAYVEKERMNELRAASLNTLYNLFSIIHDIDVLSFAFPGVSSSLVKVIVSDYKTTTTQVRIKSSQLWKLVLQLIITDEQHKDVLKVVSSSASIPSSCDEVVESFRNFSSTPKTISLQKPSKKQARPGFIICDESWITGTNQALYQLLGVLFSDDAMVSLHNVAFKLEHLDLIFTLSYHCFSFLSVNVHFLLLNSLIVFTNDPYEEVQHKAKQYLDRIMAKITKKHDLYEMILENTNAILRKLPKISRTCENSKLNYHLNNLIGYFYVLQFKMKTILNEKLIVTSLIHMLRLSSNFNRNVIEMSQENVGYYKNEFMFLTDSQTIDNSMKLIQLIGHYGNAMTLVSNLFSSVNYVIDPTCVDETQAAFMISYSDLPQCVLIINQIVIGCVEFHKVNQTSCREFVDYVFDLYTSSPILNLALSSDDQVIKYTDAALISILLQGIGNIADILKSEYKFYLNQSIFPVIKYFNDDNLIIKQASSSTLVKFANNCGFKTISGLIQQNMDYLIDSVIAKLPYLHTYPYIPGVVEAISVLINFNDDSNVNLNALALINDLMDAIMEAIDLHWRSDTLLFSLLKVLNAIIFNISNDFTSNEALQVTACEAIAPVESPIDKLIQTLSNMKGDVYSDASPEDDPAQQSGAVAQDRKSIDSLILLVKTVVLKMQHFVSHQSVFVRNTIFDIVFHGIEVLRYTTNNDLLPTIHTLWQPIVDQFADETNHSIFIKVLNLVALQYEFSHSFISQKFQSTVWPILLEKLKLYCNSTGSITNSKVLSPTPIDAVQKKHQLLAQMFQQPADDSSLLSDDIDIKNVLSKHFKTLKAILNCLLTALRFDDRFRTKHCHTVLRYTWRFVDSSNVPAIRDTSRDVWRLLTRQRSSAVWLDLVVASKDVDGDRFQGWNQENELPHADFKAIDIHRYHIKTPIIVDTKNTRDFVAELIKMVG